MATGEHITVYQYHQDSNLIPDCRVHWQGPGWYAWTISSWHTESCLIARLCGERTDTPLLPPGWRSPVWADNVQQAAGPYAKYGHRAAAESPA
jgi:hypothetical protein